MCPGPVGPGGKCSPGQVGTGTRPRTLDPGEERGGWLTSMETARQQGVPGFATRKLHSLMNLHSNGLTLRLFYFPLAETGMSLSCSWSLCIQLVKLADQPVVLVIASEGVFF